MGIVKDDMTVDLLPFVLETTLPSAQIAARTAEIHSAVLSSSHYLDGANFNRIHPADLELLFNAYDQLFFSGGVRRMLGAAPLRFGLSKRMTSAGGKTSRYTQRQTHARRYEISVSTTILFGCFQEDDHRPIISSGIVCRNRLEALQRVMEHELVHLMEMLLWEKSSCSQPRFHGLTRRFFAHTENKHQLITPRERAQVKFGIRPGVKVRFRFDGVTHTGFVNRVSRRATVLVEDSRGQRYTNGKHYLKYYIPIPSLEPVE